MKAYIIHLSQIKSSLDTAMMLQDALKSINIDAELFEGSYGDEAYLRYTRENKNLYTEKNVAEKKLPGVIGCFDSHYRLWQKCVELNEPIIIFEDDCVIYRELIPVEFNDVLVIASSHNKKMSIYNHFLDNPTGEPKAEEYSHISMPGCAGYIIKPHAAEKLVTFYIDKYLPADNAINNQLVHIQIHNYMIGKAIDDKKNVSLIKTKHWDKRLCYLAQLQENNKY